MQRYRVVIMLVLFGVVPVVAAFFFALSFLGQQEPDPPPQAEAPPVVEEEEVEPPPPPPTLTVLAAARELPVGTLLGEDDVRDIELERAMVRSGHFVSEEVDLATLRGYAVRQALAEGAPLTRAALVAPGQKGFLAAVLRPGTRAVTIRVGPSTRDAALIDPDDRVAVILSGELPVDEQEVRTFARTIVEDARVVAVNRRIAGEERDEGVELLEGDEDEGGQIATATLEVSPEDSDRLVLAEREGQLSLAVRSVAPAARQPPDEARAAALEPPAGETQAVAPEPPPSEAQAVGLEEVLLGLDAEAHAGPLEEMEERLLAEIAASEARLRGEIDAMKAQQAARRTVRIFRGTAPPQPVSFEAPPEEEPFEGPWWADPDPMLADEDPFAAPAEETTFEAAPAEETSFEDEVPPEPPVLEGN